MILNLLRNKRMRQDFLIVIRVKQLSIEDKDTKP